MAYYVPPSEKVGEDTSPESHTKLHPRLTFLKVYVKSLEEMIQIHPNNENAI